MFLFKNLLKSLNLNFLFMFILSIFCTKFISSAAYGDELVKLLSILSEVKGPLNPLSYLEVLEERVIGNHEVEIIEDFEPKGINDNRLNRLLYYSLVLNFPEKVKEYITKGADVNAIICQPLTQVNSSILKYAFQTLNPNVIIELINGGADVNVVGDWMAFGNTPLHYAVALGMPDVIAKILEKNQNAVFAKNERGLTPYDIAVKPGGDDMIYNEFEGRTALYNSKKAKEAAELVNPDRGG